MDLRPAADDDLPALHGVFLRAVAGVFRPHGFEPPAPRYEAFANQQRHLLATGTTVVAEQEREVRGFGSAWQRDAHWFLGSLFVEPGAQAVGLGTALLDAVWARAGRSRAPSGAAARAVPGLLLLSEGLLPPHALAISGYMLF